MRSRFPDVGDDFPVGSEDRKLGKYTLLDTLGSGAAGVIYHAHLDGPMGFRKQVALKTIAATGDRRSAGVRGMINEARLGGHLQHPNIVSILDFGLIDDTFYIAMEYVQGHTLLDVMRRWMDHGAVPVTVIAGIAVQICEGLAYAHDATDDQGQPLTMIHRDLKPSNVMISHRGQVKLLDFGISSAATNLYKDEPGTTAGTPAYMSPEQTVGKRLDGRSDLFSLATLIAEMILGRAVFAHEEPRASLRLVHKVEVDEALEQVWRSMPLFAPVLQRAWTADRSQRFPTAEAMSKAIRRACRGLGYKPAGEPRIALWLDRWMSARSDSWLTLPHNESLAEGDSDSHDTGEAAPLTGWERFEQTLPLRDATAEGDDELDEDEDSEDFDDDMDSWTGPGYLNWPSSSETSLAPDSTVLKGAGEEIPELEPTAEVERAVRAEDVLAWIEIRPGSFWRGSESEEQGRNDDEACHEVVLCQRYLVSNIPVTQSLWAAVMADNPAEVFAPQRPVDGVTWFDAVLFCNVYSRAWGLEPAYQIDGGNVTWNRDSRGFRLLTEAEWEFAARAGQRGPYAGLQAPDTAAWFDENCGGSPRAAATRAPNAWGIYDTCGNVWEWVWDRYDPRPETGPSVDPTGHWSNAQRVARGGAWTGTRYEVRSAIRRAGDVMEAGNDLGLRIARSLF